MLTVTIENVKNITVDTGKAETKIDFEDIKGSTARLEMTRADAEYLLVELQHVLSTN